MTRRYAPIPFVTAALVAACGGSGPDSTSPRRGDVRIVAGTDVIDTVDARLPQPLVVEVREDGNPARGFVVRFTGLPSTDTTRRGEPGSTVSNAGQDSFSSLSSDTTDASGRATALVQLGTVAGEARVLVSCPQLGITDTARFTVLPGSSTQLILGVRDTVVRVSGTFGINAYSADMYRNRRPQDTVVYQAIDGLGTVNAAGTVRARLAVGRGTIVARVRGREDSTHYTVVPVAKITAVYEGLDTWTRLATLDLDGSNFRVVGTIAPLAHPSHSPTQDLIAYSDLDGIAVVTGSGSAKVLVKWTTAPYAGYPVFSPDGQSIYFGGMVEVAPFTGLGIWRIGLDGSGLIRVASTDFGVTTPAVSPDGTKIALSRKFGMWVQSMATGDSVLVGPSGWSPDFSPDGLRVAYRVDAALVVANVDGSSARGIGANATSNARVSWLPDGKWLLTNSDEGPVLVNTVSGALVPLPSLRRFRAVTVYP